MIKYGGGVQVKIKTKRNENDNECWRLFVTNFCETLINIARRTVFFHPIVITSLAAVGLFKCLFLSQARIFWYLFRSLELGTLALTWHVNIAKCIGIVRIISKTDWQNIEIARKKSVNIWNNLRNSFFYQFLGSLSLVIVVIVVHYYTGQTLNKVMTYKRIILLRSSWSNGERESKNKNETKHIYQWQARPESESWLCKTCIWKKNKKSTEDRKELKNFSTKNSWWRLFHLTVVYLLGTRYFWHKFSISVFIAKNNQVGMSLTWPDFGFGLAWLGFWRVEKVEDWRPVFDSWRIMWTFIKLNHSECSTIHSFIEWSQQICAVLWCTHVQSHHVKWGLNSMRWQLRNEIFDDAMQIYKCSHRST